MAPTAQIRVKDRRSSRQPDLGLVFGSQIRPADARHPADVQQTEGLVASLIRLIGLSLDTPDHTTL